MDLDKYVKEYCTLTREELERIREYTPAETFEFKVRSIHMHREKEKNEGCKALDTGPLVHVLSVTLEPKKVSNKPLSVYGRIFAENCDSMYEGTIGHDLYNRERTDAEILDVSHSLTLSGPEYTIHPDRAFIPMFKNKINVQLFDGDDNIFARECFSLHDNEIEGGYEQVKFMHIPCEQGNLIVKYVAIPFGVNCRIEIKFYDRGNIEREGSIDVNGKVVASCINTYGDYDSEECVLFHMESNTFARAEIGQAKMKLSRYWVALSAYSSLVVGLNLSEFGTGRKIVDDSVKFLTKPGLMSGRLFMLDDFFIQVTVTFFSPSPLRPHEGNDVYQPEKSSMTTQEMLVEEIDEMDTETSSDDESSSSRKICWSLQPHKKKLLPSPAVEIFSVFICQEKSNSLRIHGSIEILSNDDRICYIFKRDEDDPLCLPENMSWIPILDGSRAHEDFNSLEMKFDLKDVDGSLAIKGYKYWGAEVLDRTDFRDKQLCSFIHGQNGGFVAVHYSIFSDAVLANIKVFLNLKSGCADKIYGSLISQYRGYYYSSRYNKDYYRSVLFLRSQDDSVQLNVDGSVPLSRSSIVVPTYSPLVLNVDLSSGISGHNLSCVQELEIDVAQKTIETDDFIIHIEVDWSEIK